MVDIRLPEVRLVGYTDEPLKLIEHMGRKAYGSPDSDTSEGTERWIKARLQGWEHDVLEHAQTHWEFDFSRVVAQEATRHRIAAYTMQSMRFKEPTKEDMQLVPPDVRPEDREEWVLDYMKAFEIYAKWRSKGYKRQTARYHLPMGSATVLCATWNFRELRHIFGMRAVRKAQPEFHYLAYKMWQQATALWPSVFDSCEVEPYEDAGL